MLTRGQCQSCGARIIRLRHERTRKVAPIDADPNPAGNVLVDLEAGTYRVLTREDRAAAVPPEGDRYSTHFQTCPNAEQWRRR